MPDVRKRTGAKGATYQVRYPTKGAKSGYGYKTFETLKEARYFSQHEMPNLRAAKSAGIRSVEAAIQKWLDTCEYEGRQGADPVSPATLEGYRYRAEIMRSYSWEKPLHELESPDVVAFRSWLLKEYSRDQAKKVLSSFHSALLEMVTQGVLAVDPAANVSIQQSRYHEPVQIPSVAEVKSILQAADHLASHKNLQISQAWERYRPMIYLAADSGMRPQEYLVLPGADLLEQGVRITQALDRSNRIGPPKSRAARRYIPVGVETIEMARTCLYGQSGPNPTQLLFPGEGGQHQRYNNYLRRGWHKLMEKAGLIRETDVDGQPVVETMYTPYSLRHFFASVLIAQNKDLKTIQEWMGHEDAAMTLNVYGHLIRLKQSTKIAEPAGILSTVLAI
jgi:integrase